MTETAPRPQKVTLACLFAGLGSLVVLISITTTLADWVPSELRGQVDAVLEDPPLSSYGLETDRALEWMRIALMAGGAVAIAAIVLAIHTARRHRGARVALTIVSACTSLVFLPSGLTGLIPAAMAVACVVMLWSREANDWFNPEKAARRRTQEQEAAAREPAEPSGTPVSAAPSGEPPQARPADVPFASAPASDARTFARPATPPPSAAVRTNTRLPGTILAAVLTATIASGLVAMAGAVILAGYAASPATLGTELLNHPALEDNPQVENLGWNAQTLGRIVVSVAGALFVLSLAAIAAALLMLRRSNAARILLVVLSGLTIALSAVATFAGIPTIAAAITVIVLVFRPSANAYFRRAPVMGR